MKGRCGETANNVKERQRHPQQTRNTAAALYKKWLPLHR